MEPPRTGVGEIPQEDPRTRPGTASRAADKLQPESRPKLTTLRGALSPSAEADSIPGTPRKPKRSPHNNRALFRNSPFSISLLFLALFLPLLPSPAAVNARPAATHGAPGRAGCAAPRGASAPPGRGRADKAGRRRAAAPACSLRRGGLPSSAWGHAAARRLTPPTSSPPHFGSCFCFCNANRSSSLSLGLKAVPEAARPGCAPLRSAHAAHPAPPRAPRPPPPRSEML